MALALKLCLSNYYLTNAGITVMCWIPRSIGEKRDEKLETVGKKMFLPKKHRICNSGFSSDLQLLAVILNAGKTCKRISIKIVS